MPRFCELLNGQTEPLGTGPDAGLALTVTMTDDWQQGHAAFGGIQGAIGALAMRQVVGEEPPLRALQMTFIGQVGSGPVRAEASVVRRGRNITHAQCRLLSAGKVAALLVGVYGAARSSQARLPMPMPVREAEFQPGRMPEFLRHYAQRWAGGTRMFSAQPRKPARMWARLREAVAGPDGAVPAVLATPAMREASLVALADLPPSPVLSMLDRPAAGASLTWLLEFSLDPRTFDPGRWVLLQTESRYADEGYSSQTARLWDIEGRAVGVSHQTTAIFG
ncbi:MAG: thioesterase family protein [Burkholderiales bacterium]|nr:thioesterase family protein [Burkholderiales bacterium]